MQIFSVQCVIKHKKKKKSGRNNWATWGKIMDSVKRFHVAVVLQIKCWFDLYVLWPTHFWPKKIVCTILILFYLSDVGLTVH